MSDSAFRLASALKFDSKKQDIHFWVAFYWFLNKNCWGRSVCRGVHFSQGVCHPGYDCAEVRNHFWYEIHSPLNKTLVEFCTNFSSKQINESFFSKNLLQPTKNLSLFRFVVAIHLLMKCLARCNIVIRSFHQSEWHM